MPRAGRPRFATLLRTDSLSPIGEAMRILVCGSRDWTDTGPAPRGPSDTVLPRAGPLPPALGGDLIHRELSALRDVDVVIEGEAPGADTLAAAAARELGIPVLPFPADWDRYGRGAGPVKNQQMTDDWNTHSASVLPEDLGQSSRAIRAAVFRLAGGAPADSSGRTWSSPSART